MKKNLQTGGFTLVEVMIVVSIIGLLAVVAIPSFVRAREAVQVSACLDNLRQIDYAKEEWAFENNVPDGQAVTAADLDPYLKRGFAGVIEPAGGSYTINAIGVDPVCSVYDATSHPSTL